MRLCMKRILSISFLILTTAVFSPAQSSRSEKEIRALLDRFGKAFVEADAATLETLLADDYVHTNSNGGTLNKARWLDYIRTRNAELKSGRLRVNSYINDDLKIRVYGNTAVVTGRNTSGGERDGKAFSLQLRFTHVWVKQAGQWRRAAFHDSAIQQ